MPEIKESVMTDVRVRNLSVAALAVFIVFLAVVTLGQLKGLRFIGSGVSATNTINVSGEGEVFAVPDTATFSVGVEEVAKDVTMAQASATKKGNDILAYLKGQGIDEKDIKTTDYSINPQYEWTQGVCQSSGSCRPSTRTLTGYQVSQTLSVKVRDTKKAGDVLAGVGSLGASNISGLSFTIDDQDALEAEARDEAIASAKEKAEVLAKSLGVSIVRIVGFSENGNGPIYYAKAMSLEMGVGGAVMDSAPEIATGQNKITSNVSITYEIQ